MDKKGGLVLSVIILVVVFVAGAVFLGPVVFTIAQSPSGTSNQAFVNANECTKDEVCEVNALISENRIIAESEICLGGDCIGSWPGSQLSEIYDPIFEFFQFDTPEIIEIGGEPYQIEVTDNPANNNDESICIRVNNNSSQSCGFGEDRFKELIGGLLIYTIDIENPNGNGVCVPGPCTAYILFFGTI